MKKLLIMLLLTSPIFADYVEIGSSGTLILNRPYCGT